MLFKDSKDDTIIFSFRFAVEDESLSEGFSELKLRIMNSKQAKENFSAQ